LALFGRNLKKAPNNFKGGVSNSKKLIPNTQNSPKKERVGKVKLKEPEIRGLIKFGGAPKF